MSSSGLAIWRCLPRPVKSDEQAEAFVITAVLVLVRDAAESFVELAGVLGRQARIMDHVTQSAEAAKRLRCGVCPCYRSASQPV
jgi:hypothetical protein